MWLEVASVKAASSRPAHQRVTLTVSWHDEQGFDMFRSIKSILLSWSLITFIVNTLGVTLGAIPLILLPDYDSTFFTFTLLLVSGFFIGFAQWLILRTKLLKVGRWILATTIGLPFGFFSGGVTLALMPDFPGNLWVRAAVVAVIGGTIIGILQLRALNGKLTGSFLWLLASGLSWGIALCLSGFIFDTFLSNLEFRFFFVPFLGMLIGAVVGIISGAFVEPAILQTIPKSQLT